MQKLSAYILTYNEETKIEAAIKSVTWADEVVVVDSDSTDSTVSIAEGLGAHVVNVPFEGFGKLRKAAIESCSNEWIFSLDADERCPHGAASEILKILQAPDPADAYYIPRRNWFMGRWIRFSGWYPDYRQPQLFRRGAIIFREEDEVHEGYEVRGRVGYLKNPIWQLPFRNLEQLQVKANRYSSLGSDKLMRKGVTGSMAKAFAHGLAAFFHTYIIRRGFMDGWAGFVIALGNFEGTFYRYAKLTEKQSGWEQPPDGP
ncbi:glycosyltransferase family 2 protein [Deltaproteobacteria bacterium]|nr:glycosyltransferase family 2 protein [Deltaproteobacteria bacterium]